MTNMKSRPHSKREGLSRRSVLELGALGAAAALLPRSAFAADKKLKVAAIFATPIEEPWDNQVHVALLKAGVDQRVLNTVAGWREARSLFSPRECAALQWAEAVNALPQRTPSDEEFDAAREQFKDEELSELTFAVGAIRAWNMLNAAFHMPIPAVPYVANE